MDIDAYTRRVNVDARRVRTIAPVIVTIADDDVGIRMVDAFRHARALIANLPADLVGIGGVREREPQGGRRDANQEFAHSFASAALCFVNFAASVWFRILCANQQTARQPPIREAQKIKPNQRFRWLAHRRSARPEFLRTA